ncbi:hypothetical protein [Maribacter sp.]|uniref:hypothetical protein n=1 Tax=Maribacter sp. TaxID=1897614 RepID=UPI0025C27309|nr:hypothetical protein [Maribacter sp.]
MKPFLETLFTYMPLLTGLFSLVLIFLFQFGFLTRKVAKKVTLTILLIFILLSVLPFSMVPIPTTLIYPISLGIVLFNAKTKPSGVFLNSILFVHISYWLFAMKLLTSDGNTWGNANGFIGWVSILNSILFINFFILHLNSKKWVAIFKLVAGIVAPILVYQWTEGFELGEYNNKDEEFMRISAVILSVFSIIEGLILLKKQKPG